MARSKGRPGPKPLARGLVRSEARTVKLTPAEAQRQDAAAGERPWATWAHDTLVAAAPPTPDDE